MRCRVCGGTLAARVVDMPFRRGDTSIVIIKSLPVLECSQCGDTELENGVMMKVHSMLAREAPPSELEVIRFAA